MSKKDDKDIYTEKLPNLDETLCDKILEKHKKLIDEAKEDCKFNPAQIDTSFNNTILSMKWLAKRQEWRRLLDTYEYKKKQALKVVYHYYRTEFELNLKTNEEFKLYIESDINYDKYNRLVSSIKLVCDFIDSTIDIIRSRGFEVKNYLEYLKFTKGFN